MFMLRSVFLHAGADLVLLSVVCAQSNKSVWTGVIHCLRQLRADVSTQLLDSYMQLNTYSTQKSHTSNLADVLATLAHSLGDLVVC